MSEIMPTEIHRIPPFEQRTSQEECNKQILRLLHVLRLTQQQHGEILQELCKQRVVINEATEVPLLVESPFTLVETLEAFNTSLDEIKERRLVKELAQLGGNDVRVATRRMLGYLMKDETAAEYSWLGKKGKRKFAFLKFPQVIVKAIRMNKNMSMATQDEVESTIKTWLRHAKERCGNKSAPDD
ncbi:uncharacterized protein LOC135373419 [Ornithodoros turicata]|uniref:uncharacterized protein LOC135373419 n=1 Tax=Ornithodoros turicata TaxID=34597 RepID=UPI003138F65F